ncbi:DUF2690 domain-containing protein [Streptomyces sp. NPDC006476]|uniref:DUF2690 domain-containing protein n=1 Tax=Streptomyces sp. NPDC006476 TaxID=3157175 RepID=UPI0033ADD8F0
MLLLAIPAVAMAAGPEADGLSPYTNNCASSATSIATASLAGGSATVEIRYSPSCKVAWARVQLKNEADVDGTSDVTIRRTQGGPGTAQTCQVSHDKSTSLNAYTCYTSVIGTDNSQFQAHARVNGRDLTTSAVSAPSSQ